MKTWLVNKFILHKWMEYIWWHFQEKENNTLVLV